MSDFRRVHCAPPPKGCGGHASKVGAISWRGLCRQCGKRRENENLDGMVDKTGPYWTEWRRAMVACVHPELLDRLPPGS